MIFSKEKVIVIIVFLLQIFSISKLSLGQNINTDKFEYISPVPLSKYNSTRTNIIIRLQEAFDQFVQNNDSVLSVVGTKSGSHSGKIVLTEKGNVLIFKPDKKFSNYETVTIKSNGNLKTVSGEKIPKFQFLFKTAKENNKKFEPFNFLNSNQNLSFSNAIQNKLNIKHKKYTLQTDILPQDFPEFTVDSINNPATGYIFFSPFQSNYLIIMDNYGIPIFYRKMFKRAFDFKKQPTGLLTYFDEGKHEYFVLDSSYNIVDSLQMKNGYISNLHELTMLKNKHAFLMCYDNQKVDMSKIVAGGDSNATVTGLVIQELDENKNVVFQWRSWDHLKITDATEDIDLTDSIIDYVHANAIEVDNDENILISCRHMDKIIKINRISGDIIWTLGGKKSKDNEFTFVNDTIGFSHQHDIRRLANGNISLFDNGNLHRPHFSRVVEYELDEINKTANLVWEYRNNPQTYSVAMGSVQRLDNQNTFIGWGWRTNPPSISEVQMDGKVTFYLTIPETNIRNYRAFKFPWKTNLFVTNPDSLNFNTVSVGDSLVKPLFIINNSNSEIQINGVLNRDSSYQVNTTLPIIIPPFDTSAMEITYIPKVEGKHLDDLYLQWNKTNERIAQVVHLIGETDSLSTSVNDDQNIFDYSLAQNYPNPFNPSTNINFTLHKSGRVILKIYDILGRKIRTLINKNMTLGNHEINFNAENLPSGVYIYSLRANDFFDAKKMILLH